MLKNKEMPAIWSDGHMKQDHSIISTSCNARQGQDWNLTNVLLRISTAGLNPKDAAVRGKANLANMLFLLLLPHPFADRLFFIHVFVLYRIIDSVCADNILKMFEPGGVR